MIKKNNLDNLTLTRQVCYEMSMNRIGFYKPNNINSKSIIVKQDCDLLINVMSNYLKKYILCK